MFITTGGRVPCPSPVGDGGGGASCSACCCQILFTLCDHYRSVRRAVVTMQLEVAQRVIAKPGTKQYGILSVVFQLYARPQVLFHIPPTVFYPQPSVTSALISLDFTGELADGGGGG